MGILDSPYLNDDDDTRKEHMVRGIRTRTEDPDNDDAKCKRQRVDEAVNPGCVFEDLKNAKEYEIITPLTNAARMEHRRIYSVPGKDISDQIKPDDCYIHHPMSTAVYFLDHIAPVRSRNPSYFLMIGRSLYHVFVKSRAKLGSDGDREQWGKQGFSEWLKFNPLIQEDNDVWRDHWRMFGEEVVRVQRTIRTLAFLCRSDNPLAYQRWFSDWVLDPVIHIVENEKKVTTASVAAILARFVWLEYCHHSSRNVKELYFYDKHGWNEETSGTMLRGILLNHVYRFLDDVRIALRDEDTREHVAKSQIIKDYIDNDMREYAHLVVDKARVCLTQMNFVERFKQDEEMVRFNNGVAETYDTLVQIAPNERPKAIYIREGTPEDGLLLSTNLDYPFDWTDQTSHVQEYHEWMHKIFDAVDENTPFLADGSPDWSQIPHDTLLSEVIRRDDASFARGGNPEKLARLWVGGYSGSKSLRSELMETAYGELFAKLPISIISEKHKQSGGATPELAKTEGCRLVGMDETEANQLCNGGEVKSITGNESRIIRELYKPATKMKTTWKMYIQSNFLPYFVQAGVAFDMRCMVEEYESYFSKYAPADKRTQWLTRTFQRDTKFRNKLYPMAQAYWYDVVNGKYDEYIRLGTGPDRHPKLKDATNEFNDQNNSVKAFVRDEIVLVRGSQVKIDDLFKAYEAHFSKSGMPDAIKLDAKAFVADIKGYYRLHLEQHNMEHPDDSYPCRMSRDTLWHYHKRMAGGPGRNR